jgi:hypothetical protein
MKRSKIMRKLGILLFIFIFIFTSIPLNTSKGIAAPPSVLDSLLSEWLPQPGQNNPISPFTPNISPKKNSLETFDVPSPASEIALDGNAIGGLLEDPVSLPSGSILLKQDDFILESPGFPITIQRLYLSEQHDQLGSFGYGWIFPYQHRIQMVTDYDIIEHRPDGGQIRYTFQPSNQNEMLDSFDGDPLITI